jgi:hypothetical protein
MNAETNNNATVATDNYFGGCPHCGAGLCENVRKSHYGVCETHKVFWPIGSGLFSSWQEEDEEIWRKNREMLASFTQVEPIHPADCQLIPLEQCRVLAASNEIPF